MTKKLTDAQSTFLVPPRYGLGSTLNAWIAYANGFGITLPSNLSRDQVVALLSSRGQPTTNQGATATIATDAALNGDIDATKTP